MLRKYWSEKLPEFTVVHATAPNLAFDLDSSPDATVFIEVRSHHPVLGALVDADGLLVPIGSAPSWSYRGPIGSAAKVNLSVKKGEDIAYRVAVIGPSKWFEKVDPRPVSMSRITHIAPSVPQAVRDYIDAALRARGLADIADEVLEDVEDGFDFDEGLPFEELGDGRMDDDSEAGDPTVRSPRPPPPKPEKALPETPRGKGAVEAKRHEQTRSRSAPAPKEPEQLDIEDAIDETAGDGLAVRST